MSGPAVGGFRKLKKIYKHCSFANLHYRRGEIHGPSYVSNFIRFLCVNKCVIISVRSGYFKPIGYFINL